MTRRKRPAPDAPPPTRGVPATLDAIIEAKRIAIMAAMVLVHRWNPGQFDLARLRLLQADLRAAEVEVEVLIEALEKRRRMEG